MVSKLSIKNLLIGVIAVLAAIPLVLASQNMQGAFAEWARADGIQAGNDIGKLSITAADAWSLERGAASSALLSMNAASAQVATVIGEARKTGDQAFEDLRGRLNKVKLGRAGRTAFEDLELTRNKVRSMRAQIDSEIARPFDAR
ncbi:MAG: hypothetical protein KIT00_13315, partial [Rhodospirillales bacterium]|nr:hypothetical protein [Rhodospirillales bacterium]